MTRASPGVSPGTPLTILLFPKARLLRWNQEEEEAEEHGDGGIGAVAFPSKREAGWRRASGGPGVAPRLGAVGTRGLPVGPSRERASVCALPVLPCHPVVDLMGNGYSPKARLG